MFVVFIFLLKINAIKGFICYLKGCYYFDIIVYCLWTLVRLTTFRVFHLDTSGLKNVNISFFWISSSLLLLTIARMLIIYYLNHNRARRGGDCKWIKKKSVCIWPFHNFKKKLSFFSRKYNIKQFFSPFELLPKKAKKKRCNSNKYSYFPMLFFLHVLLF